MKNQSKKMQAFFTFSMAEERASPTRRCSPLRFFPSISNLRRDQIVSKGFSFGALSFMSLALGPDLLLFFFFDELPLLLAFNVFAIVACC